MSRILQTASLSILLLVLLFAALVRGGNRPLPLMLLEIVSLVLVVLFFFDKRKNNITRYERYFLFALSLVPLIYLIPLPLGVWQLLPGMDIYSEIISTLGEQSSTHPLAVYPGIGLTSWLALLPPLAVYLTVTKTSLENLKRLSFVIIGLGVLQSLLVLIQFAQGPESVFRFGMHSHPNSGLGTYPNRNHLAGFLEMVFPIAFVLWFQYFLRSYNKGRISDGFKRIVNSKNLLLTSVVLVIFLGLVFSRSRTGLALLMLGIFLTAVILWRLLGKFEVKRSVVLIILLLMTIAAEIGLAPVLERFTQQDPLSDSRWVIFSTTFEGIQTFFPFGAGPGSYPYIYPRFQPSEITNFVNHAHNDYLEWFFEYGVFGMLIIAAGLVLLFYRWFEIFRQTHTNSFVFIQIGAGVGILLILLHSFVDFNLRIPANAIYFAFLLGLFFRREIDTNKHAR